MSDKLCFGSVLYQSECGIDVCRKFCADFVACLKDCECHNVSVEKDSALGE